MANVGRLDETFHQLLLTPPDEFVAARTALVRQLKSAGEREQAAAVAPMRRPSWVDWALNVAADEHTDEVSEFADAAEAMISNVVFSAQATAALIGDT